jgi:L-threonylcarbamoyladenylate synthase
MEAEIEKCTELLLQGKVILYPTDTIWGLGCDATNEAAVKRVFQIKRRIEGKSMLVLLDKTDRLPMYVKRIPLIAWDLVGETSRPTTFIYPQGYNIAPSVMSSDGTLAIRIVQNEFCKKLIGRLKRPIVSTSANISGTPAPQLFSDISEEVVKAVDYVVPEKFADSCDYKPSRLIKFIDDYNFVVVRE